MITRNLPPLTGGMERLNWHLAAELAHAFDVSICGPAGCADQLPPHTRLAGAFTIAPLPRFLVESFVRSQLAAHRIKPEILIAGSGVTAPHIRIAARRSGAKTLVYLHGLDLVTPHPVYRALFLPFIRRCDIAVVNSHNTARLAESRGIRHERIKILHPGVEWPCDLDHIDAATFRIRFGIGRRPLLLSVGRLTARKGLVDFVRYSLPKIVAAYPEVILLVVGGAADAQLGGGPVAIRDAVSRTANTLGLDRNLMFTGKVDEDTLSQAYRASQLHVFPVLDLPGDVEGFGMVALEAAAHGLPTIAFNVGGVADAIAQGRSGLVIPPGDHEHMSQSIIAFLRGQVPQVTSDSCRTFARPMSWTAFGTQLRAICLGQLGGQ